MEKNRKEFNEGCDGIVLTSEECAKKVESTLVSIFKNMNK